MEVDVHVHKENKMDLSCLKTYSQVKLSGYCLIQNQMGKF